MSFFFFPRTRTAEFAGVSAEIFPVAVGVLKVNIRSLPGEHPSVCHVGIWTVDDHVCGSSSTLVGFSPDLIHSDALLTGKIIQRLTHGRNRDVYH